MQVDSKDKQNTEQMRERTKVYEKKAVKVEFADATVFRMSMLGWRNIGWPAGGYYGSVHRHQSHMMAGFDRREYPVSQIFKIASRVERCDCTRNFPEILK